MNHAPGAGSIARLVDLQSRGRTLCYGCPCIHTTQEGYNKKPTFGVNIKPQREIEDTRNDLI